MIKDEEENLHKKLGIFTNIDESNFDNIQRESEEIYRLVELSIGLEQLNKKFISKNYNLDMNAIENIENKKNKKISFMRRTMLLYLLSGGIYCYFHIKKLSKLNVGFKRFYCIGGLIFSSYLLICYYLTNFKKHIQSEVNKALFIKYYPKVKDDDTLIEDINKKFDFYRKIKLI